MNEGKEKRIVDKSEIIELLRLKGWSRPRLADEVGVTENAVQRWIMGQKPADPAAKLMRFLLREARGEIRIVEVEPAAVAG